MSKENNNHKDAVDKILESFKMEEDQEVTEYLGYEPFDIVKRPDYIIQQMISDNVDIYHDAVVDVIGRDPHPFQTGYLLSTKPHRVLIAGSRIGKSINALMDAIIMASRIVPYSLRVPKGVDTGIKRPVTADNIIRFGRRDSINGNFIDHNVDARRDPSWDCGTIIGVGVYPTKKFCPPGGQIWIGSTAQALLKFWWPRVFRGAQMVIPPEAIDTSKSADGYNKQNNITHFHNDINMFFTSYESQYDKFEAEEAHAVILDEEPQSEKVLPAAASHAVYLSIVMTPYRGITYSEDFIFNKNPDQRPEVFHCCAYDSPYRPIEKINSDRKTMKPWEIKARIWGLFSEITGVPYFNREKLMMWMDEVTKINDDRKIVRYARMLPQQEYENIEDLANIQVKIELIDEWNELDTWRIFELPIAGVGYVCGVDVAEGAEDPEGAADRQAACILRKPIIGSGETKPVVVATLRSTLMVEPFANIVIQGCSYYNNAVLAPETEHGFHNGAFMFTVTKYPYFFTMMTINDKTRRPKKTKGFVPSHKSREILFKIIEKQVTDNDTCPYKDIDLVRELTMAVVGKNGRCDHTKKGSLDTTVAYGITYYVYETAPEQIKNNKYIEADTEIPFSRLIERITGKTAEKEDGHPHLCKYI